MSTRPDDPRRPILFVALQTGAGANGGIASLGQVMTGLTRYRPIVLTNIEGKATDTWRQCGLEVHIVAEAASHGLRRAPVATILTYLRYARAVRRLMRDSGARLVHANDPLAFQLALPAVKSSRAGRILLNMRDTISPGRQPPRLRYAVLFGMADHVLLLSRDMIARWAQVVPSITSKASATFSVVDIDRFSPRPLPADKVKVALLSGVVSAKKGQLDFLRHVSPLLASSGIATWLVGDFNPDSDHYAAQCRNAAAPLGDMVRFLGFQANVEDLHARAHVICISSHHEGLMRTMIEAMACARPVVSTDVASAREMLLQPGREAGAVFPIGCGPEMAQAIEQLCIDTATNERLGANGAAIARETFAADRVVEAYEASYDSLLDSTPA